MLARRRGDDLCRIAVLLDELEREHRAEPANLADDRAPRGDLVEPRAQEARDLVGALAESRRRELVEHGECGRAADRVAAERAAEAADVHRVHQLGATGHARER